MSRKQRRLIFPSMIVCNLLLGATLIFVGRAGARVKYRTAVTDTVQDIAPNPNERTGSRNRSLQPEAFRMARRLGKRFTSGRNEKSICEGSLRIGTEQRMVKIARSQKDIGESVAIYNAGSQVVLTWDSDDGPRSSGDPATGSERDLIERLVLDSPDQFVLAQLRGASYQTVERNVRPTDAGDDYAGPLWNIVRIDDPQRDENKRPVSPWRLYYLNSDTGLIDSVVSEVQGQRIEAKFSDWTERNGENFPSTITWTCQGEAIMTFRLTNISFGSQ